MNNIENIIIKPKDSDMLRISIEGMDLPLCEKIGNYVVYCSQYGRWKCPYSCLYAIKKGKEKDEF